MFLKELTTTLTQAMKNTFDAEYPIQEFQGVHCSPDFPMMRVDYPGIWVDFEPSGPVHTSGVDQLLYTSPYSNGLVRGYKTWLFAGYATYTVVALTPLERDRLSDEVIRVIAFGGLNPKYSIFRQTIQNNPWLATNLDFDRIEKRGSQASSGTPWGSDEMLYESTMAIQCVGEFVSDPSSAQFALLSEIDFIARIEGSDPPLVQTFPVH